MLPGVHYAGNALDNSVVLKTGMGSLTTSGGAFQVLDGQGKMVAGTPLTVQHDPATWPNAAKVIVPAAANAASSASKATSATARVTQAAAPVMPAPPYNTDATDDFNSALSVAARQFGLAVAVGTMAGGAIGGIAGCGLGAVTADSLVSQRPGCPR